MTFEELIFKQEDLVKSSKNCINNLNKEYNEENLLKLIENDTIVKNIIKNKENLITLIQEKKNFLDNLVNYDDMKIINQQLDKIDEKIYKHFFILRNALIKSQKDKKQKIQCIKSDEYFYDLREIRNNKQFMILAQKIIKFILIHPLKALYCSFILGFIILFAYFNFYINHIPNIALENAIYYILMATILGLIFPIPFVLIYICGPYLINNLFSSIKRPKKASQIFYFCVIFSIPSIVLSLLILFKLFKITNTYIHPKTFYAISLIVPPLIFWYLNKNKSFFNNKNDLFMNLFSVVMIAFIFSCLIVFSMALIIHNSYLQMKYHSVFLMIYSLAFIIHFIFLFCFIQNKYSIVKSIFILYGIFMIIFCALYSPRIVQILGLGYYTPDILVLRSEAKVFFPKECNGFVEEKKQSIELKKPTILSKTERQYVIDMNCSNNYIVIDGSLVLGEARSK